jgi:hypothetical protein
LGWPRASSRIAAARRRSSRRWSRRSG